MTKLKLGKYTVNITSEDKIFFPPDITKLDLVEYYKNIAPDMLPYLKNRPLMLARYPNGITGESFYQKNASEYFPEYIEHVKVPLKEKKFGDQVVCNNQASLVYLANQATITFHGWLAKKDKLDYPDKMIFDLDPEDTDFKHVCKAALLIKDILEDHGLKPFVMTTGSKGIHVVVPLVRSVKFDESKKCARYFANLAIKEDPKMLTLDISKSLRVNKIFIDILRNEYGSTAVIPYSVRAKSGAPVATPLYWHELEKHKKLSSQTYNIFNIFKKIKDDGNPWQDYSKSAKSIKSILKKIG